MEHHRRCEAYNSRASTCQAKHAYLKRKSTSYSINTKPSKSADTDRSNCSSANVSTIEEGTKDNADPQAELHTCLITTMASPSGEDLNSRLDAANAAASAAVAQAQTQLAAPSVETTEYTEDEESKEATILSESKDYEKTDLAIEDLTKRVDDLYREVMDDIELQKSKARSNDQPAAAAPQSTCQPTGAIVTANEEPVLPQDLPQPETSTENETTAQTDNHLRLEHRTANVPRPVPVYEPNFPPLGPPKAAKTDSPFFSGGVLRKTKQPSKGDGWQTLWSWNYNAEW